MRHSFPLPSISRRQKISLLHLSVVLLIIFLACHLMNHHALDSYTANQYGGTVRHVEESWTLSSQGRVLDRHAAPHSFSPLEMGVPYTFSTVLTYDGTQDPAPYMFFHTHHMFCSVYLDGEEIFCYQKQLPDKAKSPGNIYASVPLPRDCMGKELRFEILPALKLHTGYSLPHPEFGDYSSMISELFWAGLPHNIYTMLAAFLGVAAILFSSLSLTGSSYREGAFIGIFSLFFGIYNVTESPFNLFMIANPYFAYLSNYAALSLIPVAFLAFIRERLSGWQQKICTLLCLLSAVVCFTEAALHFRGVCDMREFLPCLQLITFIELFVVFILLFTAKQVQRKYVLLLQLVPIFLGMLVDTVIYYRTWNASTSDTAFTNIGVLLFMLIELHHVWQSSVEIYTASIQSHQYHKMAYVDILTNVGNRRAYEAEKNTALSRRTAHTSLLVVSADVNNLKTVNDTLGHSAGDCLIRSAANVLSDFAGSAGCVFRTGGDEFMVFLYDIDHRELDRRLQLIRQQIDTLNAANEVKLSIAIGYAYVQDGRLEEAILAADKNMYENKIKMKQCSR